MIEDYIVLLSDRIYALDKKHPKHSKRFIGHDMYPQVGSGGSWSKQDVNGQTYIHWGELWVSEQRHKFISPSSKQVLTLSSCFYIESVYIDIPTFVLRLGQIELDIHNKKGYDVDINAILYPGEGYEVITHRDELIIEINYRELL